jgi:Zn-dependent protease with chaperone function
MRIGIVALLVSSPVWLAASGLAQEPRGVSPSSAALRFFDALPATSVEAALGAVRTEPPPASHRERVRATLPRSGELRPTPEEETKLEALRIVSVYHGRQGRFDIKVIDVRPATVALYERVILLVTRPALRMLSSAELQGIVAHEVAHDFLWEEFELARRTGERRARQQLELQCDGIAALTLMALGLDAMVLPEALRKLHQFNERLSVGGMGNYPTVRERQRFVRTLMQRHP